MDKNSSTFSEEEAMEEGGIPARPPDRAAVDPPQGSTKTMTQDPTNGE